MYKCIIIRLHPLTESAVCAIEITSFTESVTSNQVHSYIVNVLVPCLPVIEHQHCIASFTLLHHVLKIVISTVITHTLGPVILFIIEIETLSKMYNMDYEELL